MAVNYVHLIPNLEAGGAERQLCNLAIAEKAAGLQPRVVVLSEKKTALRLELEQAGVEVVTFKVSGVAALLNVVRLLVFLSRLDKRYVALAAWMYHAMFFSLFVRPFNPRLRLCWMIRRTAVPTGLTGYICRFNAMFSRLVPDVIVANSVSGLQSHIRAGYYADKFIHIPNIIDCNKFVPADNKAILRRRLNIPENVRLFGCVARYAPVKGHLELLKAIQALKNEYFVCLLVGRGIDEAEPLAQLLGELVQTDRVRVIGESSDVASILPALDFLVMPSLSEGFPNVVAEAMACGVPCIVTDVGDAAAICAGTGSVVPPAEPAALENALKYWISCEDKLLQDKGVSAATVINQHYSLEKIRLKYRMLAQSELE